jgi:hypothetical protein
MLFTCRDAWPNSEAIVASLTVEVTRNDELEFLVGVDR